MKIFNLKIAVLLPVAILAACAKPAPPPPDANAYYTCSMDPQVREQKPGPGPICKMPMVRVEIAPDKKENEVKLSAEQIRLANIQTDTVRLRPLGEEIMWSEAALGADRVCTIVYHFSRIL